MDFLSLLLKICFLFQGLGRVREGEENVLIKSLQVTDSDTRGTEAWRAKFRIHGDANNHFRISTDPKTNEGLLFVNKVFCPCVFC